MKITEEIQGYLEKIKDFSGNEGCSAVCLVSDEDKYSVVIGGEKVLIVAALASEAQRNPEFRAVLHRACAVVEECDKEVKTLKS